MNVQKAVVLSVIPNVVTASWLSCTGQSKGIQKSELLATKIRIPGNFFT
jgi:hypothetical protein